MTRKKRGEGIFERDYVPSFKDMHQSTRNNSEYKWKQKGCIGALEVESEPDLHVRGKLKPHFCSETKEEDFGKARKLFEDLGLHASFIEAAEGFPAVTCCFGIIQNDHKTIRNMVPHLNDTWAKEANLKLGGEGFKVDCYVWTWTHLSGASDSTILLIRFFELQK